MGPLSKPLDQLALATFNVNILPYKYRRNTTFQYIDAFSIFSRALRCFLRIIMSGGALQLVLTYLKVYQEAA